jgi:hypothetical protein
VNQNRKTIEETRAVAEQAFEQAERHERRDAEVPGRILEQIERAAPDVAGHDRD